MARYPLLPAALTLLFLVGPAHAQTESPSAVAARLDNEVPCLDRARRRLDDTVRLLGEARAQLRLAGASELARRDAVEATQALEARIREIAPELTRCVPARGATETVVDHGSPHAVEAVNDPTDVVEQGGRLGHHAHIVVGERVDGVGHVDRAAIQRGVRGIASALDACYDELAHRGGSRHGNAHLVFTVQPNGAVTGTHVEGVTVGDATFARCLQAAVTRIDVRSPALGGNATYSYTLHY